MKLSLCKTLTLAVAILVLPATAAAVVKPDITLDNIQPSPSSPGDTVKITVLVSNDGDQKASFQPLEIETTESVSVIGTTSSLKEGFSLCGGCQKIGTVYVKIDQTAETGTYPIDISVSESGAKYTEKAELEVEGKPNLVIDTEEIHIVPEVYSSFDITVKNIGTGKATETVLDPDAEEFSVLPPSIEFGIVQPGERITETAQIAASEEVKAGIKNIHFQLNYRYDNNETSKKVKIPVNVKDKAEIAIETLESDTSTIGQPSTITMEIENLGPGEAKRISSTLNCDKAEIRTGRSFVGQLEDDESVPMVFEIVPRTSSTECTAEISYHDSQKHTLQETINIHAEASSNTFVYVIIVLALAGAGIYYWRRKIQDELAEI